MNICEFLDWYEREHRGTGTWPISLEFLARQNEVYFNCPTHRIYDKYLESRGWLKKGATAKDPHTYVYPPRGDYKQELIDFIKYVFKEELPHEASWDYALELAGRLFPEEFKEELKDAEG